MSNHQSLIDDALNRAKARLGSSVTKQASAEGGLLKQASEVADALEYLSMKTADDGSVAGSARVSILDSFFKAAADGGPVAGATTTSGTQGQVPASGKKTIQPGGSPSDTNPKASESLDGKMPENVLRQMPPATAPTPKDSGKAANVTLYDLLMQNKEAAGGGPLEMEANQDLPGLSGGGDGRAFATRLIGSNTAPVAATKREAKAPTRPRLSEVWGHTNDTQGDAEARAVWPQANTKGDIKVASMARALQQERVKEAADEKKQELALHPGFMEGQRMQNRAMRAGDKGWDRHLAHSELVGNRVKGSLGGAIKGGLGGAAAGALGGAAVGSHHGRGGALSGALTGGALGGFAGAGLGEIHGMHKADKKWLADRGIKSRWGGLSTRVSDSEKANKYRDKKASLADYSEVFDHMLNGDFGAEAQNFALSVEGGK